MIYSPVGRTAKKQIGRLPPEDLAVDRCRSPPTEPWTSNGGGGTPLASESSKSWMRC